MNNMMIGDELPLDMEERRDGKSTPQGVPKLFKLLREDPNEPSLILACKGVLLDFLKTQLLSLPSNPFLQARLSPSSSSPSPHPHLLLLEKKYQDFISSKAKEISASLPTQESAGLPQESMEVEMEAIPSSPSPSPSPSPSSTIPSQSPASPLPPVPPAQANLFDLFSCPLCLCLLNNPSTSLCGHTFCMDCISSTLSNSSCPICNSLLSFSSPPSLNITIQTLISKIFPKWTESLRFLKLGQEEKKAGRIKEAITKFTEGLEVCHHQNQELFYERALCHLQVGAVELAGKDGLTAISLHPCNGRGQLAMTRIFLKLAKTSEALNLATHASFWNPSSKLAQQFLCEALSSFALSHSQISLPSIFSTPPISLIYNLRSPPRAIEASLEEDIKKECECQICFEILCDPATTVCGHSFCRSCLVKSLEKGTKCPMCRTVQPLRHYYHTKAFDKLLAISVSMLSPLGYAEKLSAIILEEIEEKKNVPIFVCTLAYPTVRCPLSIFEPRYKLMIQRVLSSKRKRFGMCLPDPEGGFKECGTFLEIKGARDTQHGTIFLNCIGARRFTVLSKSVVDGYNVADIEYHDDEDDAKVNEKRAELQNMIKNAQSYVDNLKAGLSEDSREHFDWIYGEPPIDASDFSLWLLSIVTAEEKDKYQLFSSSSFFNRLKTLTYSFQRFKPNAPVNE